MPSVLPARIGPYRVDGLLGRGGMGEVYRAWDPRLERHVAVKRILAETAGPKARARFWREARVLAGLNHDNLVALHDIGEDEGQLYLAMELVEGRPLSEARSARWPLGVAVELVRQVAAAVGAAHARDIVHRDIKPSNILMAPDGRPRLIDFGLARRVDEDEVTSAGALAGTWSWMAPEQIGGEPVGPASDVHALGALLYTLLAGHSPYQRESREATAAAIVAGVRDDLGALRPDVPRGLEELVGRCLARAPAERPRDGGALAEVLGRWLDEVGLAPDRDEIRAAFERARSAIHDPDFATGLTGRRRVRARRRGGARLTWIAGALAVLGVVFLLMSRAPSEPALGEQVDAVQTRASLVTSRVEGAGTVLATVKAKPRRVVVVEPLASAEGSLGPVVAELLREDLATSEALVVAPWRLMLARGEAPRDKVGAHDVDIVVSGRVERVRGGLEVSLTLSDAAGSELVRLRLPCTRATLATSVRTLAVAVADALGERLDVEALPRGGGHPGGSVAAIEALLEADAALHAEHWRTFRQAVLRALAADPSLPRARLHRVTLDLAYGKREEARRELEALMASDASERDRSVARATHTLLSGGDASAEWERHLARFPLDLEAGLELLRERFRSSGAGKLTRAVTLAEELLAEAPASPQAASKLTRALMWLGRGEEARGRLAAAGLRREEGTPRQTDFVFGELALYAGRFDEAASIFESVRESDTDLTFYAAHMRVAALILGGHGDEAYRSALRLMRGAQSAEGAMGVDWTYLLAIHALLGDGRVGEAFEMARAWPEVTGPTPGASTYRSLVRVIEALSAPYPSDIANAVASDADPSRAGLETSWMVLAFGDDPEVVRHWLETLRGRGDDLVGQVMVGPVLRFERGLEARLRFLDGDVEGALAEFARLAFSKEPALSEGELFERTRWLGIYALHLAKAGYPQLAAEMWSGLLGMGYGRLLAMEQDHLARVGLARMARVR